MDPALPGRVKYFEFVLSRASSAAKEETPALGKA
jgi:hypothetical protein